MNLKTIIIILSLCFAFNMARGQDLIITTVGDSVKCRIIDIGKDFIVYENMDEHKVYIDRRRVAKIDYDFYSKKIRVAAPGRKEWTIIRVSLDGGAGFMLGKIDKGLNSELQDYYKKLKSGWVIGLTGDYFIREYFGFGLKYNLNKTRYSADNLSVNAMDGRLLTGSLSNSISIHYIGPDFAIRYMLPDTKFNFLLNFGMGYMHYGNKESFNDSNKDYSETYKLTGSSVGLSAGISADYYIYQDYAVGIGITYTYGSLGKVEVNKGNAIEVIRLTGLSGNDRVNLSHLDITIGIRWSYY